MRILIVSQWFDPEPTCKGLLFARELVARGHQVEVLTGFPNYPGGKVYPGYRIRPWAWERLDGIDVLRVCIYPSHDNSGFQRVLNYMSFALSAAVIGTALIRKPDVMYVYHPPITVGLAAAVIGFLRRTPFLYDIQDLWPDTVAASGMMSNPTALGLLGNLCKFVYRRASHITVLSPGFKKTLTARGVPSGKMDAIYNWCQEESVPRRTSLPAERLGRADRFCVLFAGTMGRAQGLDSVLLAAQICQTSVPIAEFLFMGAGVDRSRLERMAEELQLDNVRFLPPQPMQAMGRILAGADALLVHLKDDPLFRITIPSKTQAYLAAGKPILMAVRGDAADLVKRSQSGVLCQPGDPQSIADAVKKLIVAGPEDLASMGRNGKAFYDGALSLSIGAGEFDRIFKMVIQTASRMHSGQSGCRLWIKKLFDRSAALCGLVVLSPLFIIASLLVWLSMGRPLLFCQQRPGRFGRPFVLFKFRTMSGRRDTSGNLLPDADRLTRIGRLLRATSLDELPQLWNVLRGDMSLVGPRPLLMDYLPRYLSEQARRHDVMPGITGWAQTNGRNSLSWEEKFSLDVWYVENWSLMLDFRIIMTTFTSVLRRQGIQSTTHVTMPEFLGNSNSIPGKELLSVSSDSQEEHT
jgi:lipopolysaccharide/colanic/teichoic acid biosynthesis glycosyltransferase/glycosyltransferase involved in cell wall biosynthesis